MAQVDQSGDQHFQAAMLGRLFSSTLLQELCGKTEPLLFREIWNSSLYLKQQKFRNVGDIFDIAFKYLSKPGLRSEYIYRSSLTNKILLGRHNLRTATMVNEFRVGCNRADAVIFNGTSTAYEIKSERDSLVKLQSQIIS